jgi:hypothetical protein
MTRALTSLAGTVTEIPDSARYLIPRPGDAELTATVIEDRGWLVAVTGHACPIRPMTFAMRGALSMDRIC